MYRNVILRFMKVMNLEAGQYIFECYLMPWTAYGLTGNYEAEIDVSIDLSLEEIQGLIDMMHWAWKNNLFEYSTSEMVCTFLLEERQPQIYDRVYPLVHKLFCENQTRQNIHNQRVYSLLNKDYLLPFIHCFHVS